MALAVVNFPDPATATAVRRSRPTPPARVDHRPGRRRRRLARCGPKSFNNAAYTVTVQGTSVRLTEVVWDDGTSSPTDPALAKLAATSAGLPGNQ